MSEKKYTWQESLDLLKKGNAQYLKDQKHTASKIEAKELRKGQWPYAIILSCADSRVVPEDIFCANPGELFTNRVAGNISPPSITASIEYAVAHLSVPLIVVMGHEACGAVGAALDFVQNRGNLGDNLNELVSYIIPAVNDPITDDKTTAIKANARVSAQGLLRRSEIISAAHASGTLAIVTAYYKFDGTIEWGDGASLA